MSSRHEENKRHLINNNGIVSSPILLTQLDKGSLIN